jgi:hypothetical protein
MTGSQDNSKSEKTVPAKISEKTYFEDEINLIDYVNVLWKHRYLILAGSILPSLVIGLVLFLRPTDYQVTYTYDVSNTTKNDIIDWNLNQTNYDYLLDQYYSEKNIDKIIKKLQDGGLVEYALLLDSARITQNFEKYIYFEVSPPYPDLTKLQITNAAQLEEIKQLQPLLLKITIKARPADSVSKIFSVIRENFENIVPIYLIARQLNVAADGLKADMADIEKNKFDIEIALLMKKSTLEKLKVLKVESPDKSGMTVIQFNSDKNDYLPLEYQIQAKEFQVVEDEQQIKLNEAKFDHDKNLLELNAKLSAELKSNASSYYTIQQFYDFLVSLTNNYVGTDVKDYLSSLIKRVENRISANVPVNEKPLIDAVSKGTAKKTTIVFMVSFMISIFAAFLIEGIQKSRSSAV